MQNKLELMKRIWELTKAVPNYVVLEVHAKNMDNIHKPNYTDAATHQCILRQLNDGFAIPYYSESWLWRELPSSIRIDTILYELESFKAPYTHKFICRYLDYKNMKNLTAFSNNEDMHTALLELFIWVVEQGYWRKDD